MKNVLNFFFVILFIFNFLSNVEAKGIQSFKVHNSSYRNGSDQTFYLHLPNQNVRIETKNYSGLLRGLGSDMGEETVIKEKVVIPLKETQYKSKKGKV